MKSHVEDPTNEDKGENGIPKWQFDLSVYGEKRLNDARTSRITQKELPTKPEDLEGFLDDAEMGFDTDVCNRMYVADLLSCLNKRQQWVIHLYYWEDLTFEEIAAVLNAYYEQEGIDKHATRKSVSQMVSRAIKKMRKCVKENKGFWF